MIFIKKTHRDLFRVSFLLSRRERDRGDRERDLEREYDCRLLWCRFFFSTFSSRFRRFASFAGGNKEGLGDFDTFRVFLFRFVSCFFSGGASPQPASFSSLAPMSFFLTSFLMSSSFSWISGSDSLVLSFFV